MRREAFHEEARESEALGSARGIYSTKKKRRIPSWESDMWTKVQDEPPA